MTAIRAGRLGPCFRREWGSSAVVVRKAAFDSREDALRAGNPQRTKTYHCPKCKKWHLTSKKNKG